MFVLKLGAGQVSHQAYQRQGKAVTNFKKRLPAPHSDLADEAIKDPYKFDFLTLSDKFRERELEVALLKHLEKFMIELGKGFAFVGRQYHLAVSDSDYYIDLLFYHLKLRSYFVIELKSGICASGCSHANQCLGL